MRLVLLALCVIFAFVNPADAQGHGSSVTEAIACGDLSNALHCKTYISGFADTAQMILTLSTPSRPVCNDLPNLMYEFIHEVTVNPKARQEDTQHVLFDLLTRDTSCKTASVHGLTAGDFMEVCKDGFTAFNICSEYQAGFLDAAFLLDADGKSHALCGNRGTAVNVIPRMNEQLQADYTLRSKPAALVMLKVLFALMPCPKLPAK